LKRLDTDGAGWATMLGNIGPVNQGFSPTKEHTMANLKAIFEKAVADSKNLPEKPDNLTLLKIYSLYKQATEGDVEGKRPGFTDMVGRAKFDAWAAVKGKSTDEAMQEYVDLIESLK
jgi:diazepam-binding inhibitor (GABA receptor modulator, acyl-CoA-binding protein)